MKNQKSGIVEKKQSPKSTGSKPKINGPVHVTDANLNSVVKKNPLVLIDFWAEWCGPCKALAPTIESLAEDYHGRVLVGKLDVDKNKRIANRFKVSSIPTSLIFKNGEKVGKIVGYVPKLQIETALKKHLGDSQAKAQDPK